MQFRLGTSFTTILALAGMAATAGCQVADNGLGLGGATGISLPDAGQSPTPTRPGGPVAPGIDPAPAPGPSGMGAGGSGTPGQPAADGGAPSGNVPGPDAGPKPTDPPVITPPPGTDAGAPTDVAPAPTPTPTPVNACSQPSAGPVNARPVTRIRDSDEFTFDNEGHLIALSGNDVVRVGLRSSEIIARNLIALRGGGALRMLSDGDLLVADYTRDRLVRVDARTGLERIPMQVRSPMKMAQGPGNQLYVTSNDGVVYRINALNGLHQPIAETRLRLSGITFSRDYQTLYVGALDERAIYTISLQPGGTAGRPAIWARQVGQPQTLTTDECGRVYVAGGDDGRIRRVGASAEPEVLANLNRVDIWAIAFGSGRQGWADTSLFALDDEEGTLYELPVGVKGSPPPPR